MRNKIKYNIIFLVCFLFILSFMFVGCAKKPKYDVIDRLLFSEGTADNFDYSLNDKNFYVYHTCYFSYKTIVYGDTFIKDEELVSFAINFPKNDKVKIMYFDGQIASVKETDAEIIYDYNLVAKRKDFIENKFIFSLVSTAATEVKINIVYGTLVTQTANREITIKFYGSEN